LAEVYCKSIQYHFVSTLSPLSKIWRWFFEILPVQGTAFVARKQSLSGLITSLLNYVGVCVRTWFRKKHVWVRFWNQKSGKPLPENLREM